MSGRNQRTRTGCWTCRDRSVKCDEQRPTCLKCRKANLSCSYGMRLIWMEDSVARGVCHGREGAGLKKSKKAQRPIVAKTRPPRTPSTASSQLRVPPRSRYTDTSFSTYHFLHTSFRDLSIYFRTLPEYTCEDNTDISSELDWEPGQRSQEDDELGIECGARDTHEVTASTNGANGDFYSISSVFSGRWSCVFGNISSTEAYILDFYEASVCSMATMMDDKAQNPFRNVILPMAVSSERIYHGVLAVAADKLARKSRSYRAAALSHLQHALSGLRQFLANMRRSPGDLADALASALLLCWFEVADHCRSTWTDHLHAISILLDACESHSYMSPSEEEVVRFCKQYFAYHLIMAKTVFRIDFSPTRKSSSRDIQYSLDPSSELFSTEAYVDEEAPVDQLNWLDSMDWLMDNTVVDLESVSASPHGNDGSVDIPYGLDRDGLVYINGFQGFSNELLLLIEEITELKKVNQDVYATEAQVTRIENDLRNLRQVLPWQPDIDAQLLINGGCEKQQTLEDAKTEVVLITAEAHRKAAFLFLDETCALCWPMIIPECRNRRQDIINDILRISLSIPPEHITAAFPIWAVFIAGCVATSEEQRLNVLGIFKLLEDTRFGSYPPALEVIQTVWRQRDLTCDENPRTASSHQGPFRTWKSCSVQRKPQAEQPPRASFSHAQRDAIVEQHKEYAWENALTILGGRRLSLT